ncbi:peptidoglycan editing factor PgeF [Methylothermus subterraneus]
MNLIFPDWPAPSRVKAAVTLRTGGVSQGPFSSWNLAAHVGDDPEAVARNRQILRERLDLPAEPIWLAQRHGNRVVAADAAHSGPPPADASFTASPNVVCAVLTADCLPILLTDGHTVAAVHAGWRGILAGIIEQAIALPAWRRTPIAWLGPAIGPEVFEVGQAVRDAFVNKNPSLKSAFCPRADRYVADLYALAKRLLNQGGVRAIYGGGFCTYRDARFFSYRRDGACGRMASLIWRS